MSIGRKHSKALAALDQEANEESSNTLANLEEENVRQIKNSLQRREMDFQQELASKQGQLSVEDGDRLIAEHQKEMAALKENMENEKQQQKKVINKHLNW